MADIEPEEPICCPWCGGDNIFVMRAEADDGGVFVEYDADKNPVRQGVVVTYKAEIECYGSCGVTTSMEYEEQRDAEDEEEGTELQ